MRGGQRRLRDLRDVLYLPQQRHVLVKEHAPPMLHAPHHEPTLGVRVDDRGPARAHQVEILHGVGRVSPTRQHGRRPTAPSKRERARASEDAGQRAHPRMNLAPVVFLGLFTENHDARVARWGKQRRRGAHTGSARRASPIDADPGPGRTDGSWCVPGSPNPGPRRPPRGAHPARVRPFSRYRLFSFLLPDVAALTGSTRRSPAFVSPGQEEEAERGGEGRQGCGEGGQGGGETTQG